MLIKKIFKFQGKGGAVDDPIIAGVPIVNEIFGEFKQRPRKFSLRSKMPRAGRQLNFDCVGWAGSYLGEFFERKETNLNVDFSGLALYSIAKTMDGMPREAGTFLSYATYIPERNGYFFESDYPEVGGKLYEIKPEHRPPAMAYKLKSSVMVERGDQNTFDGLKEMLSKLETPVVIGVDIWENFYPDRKGKIPPAKGKRGMGHAIIATGYDDDAETLEFLNSWGNNWGDEGYGYLPYGYPAYATGWTAIDLPNDWESPKPVNSNRYGKKRNLESEQRNAEMLRSAIYRVYPAWDRARAVANKFWFMYVNAVVYGGYSYTDIVNDLYRFSRNGIHVFDFDRERRW